MVDDDPIALRRGVLAVEPAPDFAAEHEDVARVWDDLLSGSTVGTRTWPTCPLDDCVTVLCSKA
jgi:hypothetical protein